MAQEGEAQDKLAAEAGSIALAYHGSAHLGHEIGAGMKAKAMAIGFGGETMVEDFL